MEALFPLKLRSDNRTKRKADKAEAIYCDPLSGLRYVDTERVPLMPFHHNKVISLFSGAGGMDIGLEAAGFETAVCVELDKDCRATLAYNRPEWKLALGPNPETPGDIRSLSGRDILAVAGLRKGEAALVVGGPPCQPFSNIGKKQGADDPVNGDLYSEFVRVVGECLPQGFIFENVEGLRWPHGFTSNGEPSDLR